MASCPRKRTTLLLHATWSTHQRFYQNSSSLSCKIYSISILMSLATRTHVLSRPRCCAVCCLHALYPFLHLYIISVQLLVSQLLSTVCVNFKSFCVCFPDFISIRMKKRLSSSGLHTLCKYTAFSHLNVCSGRIWAILLARTLPAPAWSANIRVANRRYGFIVETVDCSEVWNIWDFSMMFLGHPALSYFEPCGLDGVAQRLRLNPNGIPMSGTFLLGWQCLASGT